MNRAFYNWTNDCSSLELEQADGATLLSSLNTIMPDGGGVNLAAQVTTATHDTIVSDLWGNSCLMVQQAHG
jgi:hypothetical protein